jgi:hypothetical protein
MAPGISAYAPVVLWYRVERSSSLAGVAPAGVQRFSRRTFSPTTATIQSHEVGNLARKALRSSIFENTIHPLGNDD